MVYVILVILGACFGSFINALVYRIHEQPKAKGKTQKAKLSMIHGRSMCVYCGHELGPRDLVPVLSWVMLRGKCRYCHKTIDDNPLTELITPLLFVISYALWPRPVAGVVLLEFVAWLLLLVVLIALTLYDLRHMLLPNKLVYAGGVVVGIFTLVRALTDPGYIIDAAAGLVAFGGLFYVLFQVSRGKWIGGGDVKLGFVLGAWLADWRLSLLALFIASLIGTLLAAVAIPLKKISMKSKVPFGPLLILGTIIATFFGHQLIDWYTNLILGGVR